MQSFTEGQCHVTLKQLITSDVSDVFLNTTEFAEAISYYQGAGAAISIPRALPHDVQYESQDEEGFTTSFTRTDWMIPVSALAVTPRAGDRIERTVGTEMHTYELMPIDNARQVAALDESGNLWMVHSRRVA